MIHSRRRLFFAGLSATLCFTASASAQEGSDNPFVGRWALTIPGGGAGWLGVTYENGFYDASILWGGGSVVPVDSVFFSDEETMIVTRSREVERKNAEGKVIRKQRFVDAILAKRNGEDKLDLTIIRPNTNGHGVESENFTGQRIPPLPSAPDLSSVKFGEPVALLNGKNLDGWELTDPNSANGWEVEAGGILTNNPVQEEGKPHKSYGNLRTKQSFEDFNLKLEVRVPKGGNSGIYLRGIYEVQVSDTYGKPLNSHNMGSIYSRLTPLVSAEKPAGEWQTYDITLVDRHVTVVLNGKTIHDNAPLLGCTGGALWSDESKPGPIYLQGDHTRASYRNIELRPVVEN